MGERGGVGVTAGGKLEVGFIGEPSVQGRSGGSGSNEKIVSEREGGFKGLGE